MATSYGWNWSWVNAPVDTARESGAVLQDGGTVFSFRQAATGQVSSKDLNAFATSVGQNFQAIRSNFRTYTRPILNSLPAGSKDKRWSSGPGKALPAKIDCFTYGVQGSTLFVFNDATSTKADGRYWDSTEYRPKTIAESFEDVYETLSEISTAISTDATIDLDPLWAAIGESYRSSSKVTSAGSLDTRVGTIETYFNRLNTDIYEPTTYPYSIGGTSLPYSVAKMVDELLQLHNGSGWGSDPTVINHTGVPAAAHVHPYSEIQPALPTADIQARVGPYASLENDIKRLRYEIQVTRGSTSWYADVTDPVTSTAGNLLGHMSHVGTAVAHAENPHRVHYTRTGASDVFTAIRSYTGMADNTDVDPLYTSTNYVIQGTSLTAAISALDSIISSSGVTTYLTVIAAEIATGSDNDICYVIETESFYRYELSAATYSDDNTYVLSTGDGGNTKWLAVGGKYSINRVRGQEALTTGTGSSVTITIPQPMPSIDYNVNIGLEYDDSGTPSQYAYIVNNNKTTTQFTVTFSGAIDGDYNLHWTAETN